MLGSSLDSEYCAYHFFSGGVFVFPNCLLVSMDNLFLQCRYMEENGHSSSITARAAHIIGRLGGWWKNCDFFMIVYLYFWSKKLGFLLNKTMDLVYVKWIRNCDVELLSETLEFVFNFLCFLLVSRVKNWEVTHSYFRYLLLLFFNCY